jgi:hypothetical protein
LVLDRRGDDQIRQAPPGAVGTVTTARLNPWRPLVYDYAEEIIHAAIDPDTGTVTFAS